ncbi:MAG: DUF3383 family protein [Lachnospiraceae bacterium]|nr:DUF3383 family protein [Lachnospiraceae bacterium]
MLNMNPVVRVNVSIGASSTLSSVFDIGAILTSEAGTTDPLSASNRFVTYVSLEEVLNGNPSEDKPAYAASTDTYKAAAKYFSVSPAPKKLCVIFFNAASGSTETPVTALADAIDKGVEFYGLYYIPKPEETAANIKTYITGIVSALDAIERGVLFYGFTGTVESAIGTDSIVNSLFDARARRAVGMYCASSLDDAAGMMGVAMGYTLSAETSAFALCYKGIASAAVNDLTQTEVDSIKEVNGNVFIARTKGGAKIENGATASGLRYDEVMYIDMLVKQIQEGLYAAIADSPTRLPASDATSSLFIGEIYRVLEEYYNLGVLAETAWNGDPVGTVGKGDMVGHGYYAYADSFDTQSAEDRAAHKSMPITVIICLSSSVESVVINLDVQT